MASDRGHTDCLAIRIAAGVDVHAVDKVVREIGGICNVCLLDGLVCLFG